MFTVCKQCRANIELKEGESFHICSYCGSALYIDKSGLVFHYVIESNYNKESAIGNQKRWLAGNKTIKDLDKKAKIESIEFFFFPLWLFKVKLEEGIKRFLKPAAPIMVNEINDLTVPAGDLKYFDEKLFDISKFKLPNIMYNTALDWLREEKQIQIEDILESSLIHIPLYIVKYSFENKTYHSLIEASSGKVIGYEYPRKKEWPYIITAIISILLFSFGAYTVFFKNPIGAYKYMPFIFEGVIIIFIFILSFIVAKKV